ncbi:unnamed protein product, partial [Prunus brigantina]
KEEKLKNVEKNCTGSEPTKLTVSTISEPITTMLPIFSSSTSLAPFSASEIEIEIASNHPGAPGVKTGQTRKTSFLIPHHTCYPVTEDKGGRVQTQKERRFKSYRRDSVQVIYQYLDENKSLILKIIESQNTGKLSECAE